MNRNDVITRVYSDLYQLIDATCASGSRALPPGAVAQFAAGIHRLRAIGAPQAAIRAAEQMSIIAHRLQLSLHRPGPWSALQQRALRSELGRIGTDWLRDAPILH